MNYLLPLRLRIHSILHCLLRFWKVIHAANEVIDSIDRDELAKSLFLKNDLEDDEAEIMKKKMENTRDQLAEAVSEMESLRCYHGRVRKLKVWPTQGAQKTWIGPIINEYLTLMVSQTCLRRTSKMG